MQASESHAVKLSSTPILSRLARCRASDTEDNVIGKLGGRDIVQAGSFNPQDFFVKSVTKGKVGLKF